jgi:polyhydroxyalkanoate depolymerase
MELPAEFYLQTVRRVFQEHALPRGRFEWRGRRVGPRAVRRTALFTVEGEKDGIGSVSQTLAVQELCSGLRPFMKRHHCRPAPVTSACSMDGAGAATSIRSDQHHLRQRMTARDR